MDGTFVKIKRPASQFANHWYCRKQFFAIHMLALCDWRMIFTFVDVGSPGNTHDSTAFLQSTLYDDILSNAFPLNQGDLKYKILTDSAFRQQSFIVKTNTTSHHRDRIARMNVVDGYKNIKSNESGRTCIESIFGIFVNRWRIFWKKLKDETNLAKYVVIAGVCMHNFLQLESYGEYNNTEYSNTE